MRMPCISILISICADAVEVGLMRIPRPLSVVTTAVVLGQQQAYPLPARNLGRQAPGEILKITRDIDFRDYRCG